MAATNYDYSGFFEQRPQIAAQYHFGSCKVEAARGNHYTSSSTKEQQNSQMIHISNNAYYGHHPAKPYGAGPHDVDDTRLMDCDMAPISSYCTPERTLGRKRASDDVSYASFKRFRQECTFYKQTMFRCTHVKVNVTSPICGALLVLPFEV